MSEIHEILFSAQQLQLIACRQISSLMPKYQIVSALCRAEIIIRECYTDMQYNIINIVQYLQNIYEYITTFFATLSAGVSLLSES